MLRAQQEMLMAVNEVTKVKNDSLMIILEMDRLYLKTWILNTRDRHRVSVHMCLVGEATQKCCSTPNNLLNDFADTMQRPCTWNYIDIHRLLSQLAKECLCYNTVLNTEWTHISIDICSWVTKMIEKYYCGDIPSCYVLYVHNAPCLHAVYCMFIMPPAFMLYTVCS